MSWIIVENFFFLFFVWVSFGSIALVIVYGMLKGKEKVIEVDNDELDFLPGLLADPAFNYEVPLEPTRSSVGTSARRMSPSITSSPSNNGDEGSYGSKDTLSEDPCKDSGDMSLLEISRSKKKSMR